MTQANSSVPSPQGQPTGSSGSVKLPWTVPTLRKSPVPEVTQAAANTMGDAVGSS